LLYPEVIMKLEKFVVGWPMPEAQLERFRTDFSSVKFVQVDPKNWATSLLKPTPLSLGDSARVISPAPQS